MPAGQEVTKIDLLATEPTIYAAMVLRPLAPAKNKPTWQDIKKKIPRDSTITQIVDHILMNPNSITIFLHEPKGLLGTFAWHKFRNLLLDDPQAITRLLDSRSPAIVQALLGDNRLIEFISNKAKQNSSTYQELHQKLTVLKKYYDDSKNWEVDFQKYLLTNQHNLAAFLNNSDDQSHIFRVKIFQNLELLLKLFESDNNDTILTLLTNEELLEELLLKYIAADDSQLITFLRLFHKIIELSPIYNINNHSIENIKINFANAATKLLTNNNLVNDLQQQYEKTDSTNIASYLELLIKINSINKSNDRDNPYKQAIQEILAKVLFDSDSDKIKAILTSETLAKTLSLPLNSRELRKLFIAKLEIRQWLIKSEDFLNRLFNDIDTNNKTHLESIKKVSKFLSPLLVANKENLLLLLKPENRIKFFDGYLYAREKLEITTSNTNPNIITQKAYNDDDYINRQFDDSGSKLIETTNRRIKKLVAVAYKDPAAMLEFMHAFNEDFDKPKDAAYFNNDGILSEGSPSQKWTYIGEAPEIINRRSIFNGYKANLSQLSPADRDKFFKFYAALINLDNDLGNRYKQTDTENLRSAISANSNYKAALNNFKALPPYVRGNLNSYANFKDELEVGRGLRLAMLIKDFRDLRLNIDYRLDQPSKIASQQHEFDSQIKDLIAALAEIGKAGKDIPILQFSTATSQRKGIEVEMTMQLRNIIFKNEKNAKTLEAAIKIFHTLPFEYRFRINKYIDSANEDALRGLRIATTEPEFRNLRYKDNNADEQAFVTNDDKVPTLLRRLAKENKANVLRRALIKYPWSVKSIIANDKWLAYKTFDCENIQECDKAEYVQAIRIFFPGFIIRSYANIDEVLTTLKPDVLKALYPNKDNDKYLSNHAPQLAKTNTIKYSNILDSLIRHHDIIDKKKNVIQAGYRKKSRNYLIAGLATLVIPPLGIGLLISAYRNWRKSKQDPFASIKAPDKNFDSTIAIAETLSQGHPKNILTHRNDIAPTNGTQKDITDIGAIVPANKNDHTAVTTDEVQEIKPAAKLNIKEIKADETQDASVATDTQNNSSNFKLKNN